MSADIYTTATQLAILMAGRTPVWEVQDDAGSEEPPATGVAGVALEDAVRTLVHVALREDAHHRTARLTIPTVDLTCIYTVTIDGTAVAYDAGGGGAADLEDIVQGIAAAINANGTVNQIVVADAIDTDDDNLDDTVLIEGLGEADYSIDFTENDAAMLACVADLCRATMRLWWLPDARVGSTPPDAWDHTDEADVRRRGFLERFDCAGLARLHVQLSDRVGHSADGDMVTYADPVISIGPCLAEEE